MKRTLTLVLIIFTLLMNITVVFAGDYLSKIIGGDKESSVIIGEVVGSKQDKFEVNIKHTIRGKIKENTSILLKSNFKYSNTDRAPQVGDKFVLSIDDKKEGDSYKLAWGAYKANSTDYKNLELEKDVFYEGQKADIAALQWYINSNGKEYDFFFEGSKAFVRRESGEILQLYPIENMEEFQLAKKDISSLKEDNKKEKPVYFYGSMGLGIVIVIALLVKYKKN